MARKRRPQAGAAGADGFSEVDRHHGSNMGPKRRGRASDAGPDGFAPAVVDKNKGKGKDDPNKNDQTAFVKGLSARDGAAWSCHNCAHLPDNHFNRTKCRGCGRAAPQSVRCKQDAASKTKHEERGAGSGQAASADTKLRQELRDLRARSDKLEKENASLRQGVTASKAEPAAEEPAGPIEDEEDPVLLAQIAILRGRVDDLQRRLRGEEHEKVRAMLQQELDEAQGAAAAATQRRRAAWPVERRRLLVERKIAEQVCTVDKAKAQSDTAAAALVDAQNRDAEAKQKFEAASKILDEYRAQLAELGPPPEKPLAEEASPPPPAVRPLDAAELLAQARVQPGIDPSLAAMLQGVEAFLRQQSAGGLPSPPVVSVAGGSAPLHARDAQGEALAKQAKSGGGQRDDVEGMHMAGV